MKRFKVRKRHREKAGRAAYGERPARRGGRRRRFENGEEIATPRVSGAPLWPGEVAVPWDRLLKFLLENREPDLSLWQILDSLGLDTGGADLLREQIALLEREGIAVHHRRGRVALRSRHRLIVGRLSVPASSRSIGAHSGASGSFGFVAAAGRPDDLFVPARGLGGARHGDLVLARESSPGRSGRTQGAVVAILSRASAFFAGEVVEIDGRLRVRPRDERTAADLPLAAAAPPADPPAVSSPAAGKLAPGAERRAPQPAPGDLVWAEIVSEGAPRARVVEVIGPAVDAIAAEAMIRKALDLPGDFPPEVEKQAEQAARSVGESDLRGREDFREQTVITIDPADARDFDDAISVEPLESGRLRLWVHIADVARYVVPGGEIDREAFARGTSVYFPRRVIPMLPHALSSGVASLKEGEERLVQSVGIDYSRDAKVVATRFAAGVIRSAARLTYEEAAETMADPRRLSARGAAGERVAALLGTVAPLARRLTEIRIARGALDLDLPEIEFRPGEGAMPATLRTRERSASHRLVEEFMLAANEAVARHLTVKEVAAIYRVHEPPDQADVEEVEETLAALGAGRKAGRSMGARLQHLLNRFRGKPEEGIVARHVLRAMKLARYSEIRADHFGLALTHYTHFTSPIRRYPDLIVHRILKGLSEPRPARGGRDLAPARLAEIAVESSRLERRAEEAERAINDILMAQHMRPRVGEVFEGRVAGLVKTGIFVQLRGKDLPEGAAEGFAPSERAARFVLTEPVRVRLEAADLLRGRLRLELT